MKDGLCRSCGFREGAAGVEAAGPEGMENLEERREPEADRGPYPETDRRPSFSKGPQQGQTYEEDRGYTETGSLPAADRAMAQEAMAVRAVPEAPEVPEATGRRGMGRTAREAMAARTAQATRMAQAVRAVPALPEVTAPRGMARAVLTVRADSGAMVRTAMAPAARGRTEGAAGIRSPS